MTYVWTASVMAAAGVIVYRCLAIANAMDANSNHGIRIAACLISMIALGEILAPIAGRIPDVPEGWIVLSMGLYFAAEKRRPVFKREREQRGAEA